MPSTKMITTGEDIYVQVYFYRSRLVNSHQKTVANFNLLVRRITTAWNTDIKKNMITRLYSFIYYVSAINY